MDNTEELRTVAFCAGYAGIERGIELTGQPCRVVAYSEIEAYPVANLVAKMEAGALDEAPIWTNLKTFPMEIFRGKVDLLTGGFPCQPFSAAGSRGADEDPRHLFPYFKRFAETVKPRFVFLENVDGIASAKLGGDNWADPKGTPVLLHVCRELERVGYRVAAGCFSAREVGASHKRRRWFILGELGHSNEQRLERYTWDREDKWERWQAATRSITATSIPPTRWPAPPGPYQYEWEEPRTVSNPTQPQLGRTIDGSTCRVDATANRVDRLKLCGNGVVPQTAAVAWVTLINQLNQRRTSEKRTTN